MIDLESIAGTEEFLQFSLEDRIKMCMFCYGREDVINISDAVFQGMMKNLPEDSPLHLLEWDDIQQEDVQYMLDALGLKLEAEHLVTTQEEDYLELQNLWDKNRSISMIETMEEAKKFATYMLKAHDATPTVKSLPGKLALSLKYDGWNITIYYVPNVKKPVLIHTRARTGKAIYCTELLRNLMPELEVTEVTRVVGELCLDEEALLILKRAYPNSGKKFVNTRNSVSSVVHGTVDLGLIKAHIHYFAFAYQTVKGNVFNSYYETMEYLESVGFEVPFCGLIDSLDELEEAMGVLTEYYKKLEKQVQCDGVVMEPNYFDAQSNCLSFASGNNQTGLIAIKAEYWSKVLYESVVVDIIAPKSEQNRSLIAIVEPVRSSSGSMLSRVPLINCRRAREYGRYVNVGDKILFTYHSQQILHFEGFADTIKQTIQKKNPIQSFNTK